MWNKWKNHSEYGCRDAPCEKSWKQGYHLSNTIKDTSTIMRNPSLHNSGIGLRMIVLVSLIVLLRGYPCFHDFSHGASLHPYSFIFPLVTLQVQKLFEWGCRDRIHHANNYSDKGLGLRMIVLVSFIYSIARFPCFHNIYRDSEGLSMQQEVCYIAKCEIDSDTFWDVCSL